MAWSQKNFSGTKIALRFENSIMVYLRDDISGIKFPAHWDLPGGGREENESPIECVIRETEEEFGLKIDASRISDLRRFPSTVKNGLDTFFCTADITQSDLDQVKFGNEGQHWRLMPIHEFISHPLAVPHLKERVRDVLIQQDASAA